MTRAELRADLARRLEEAVGSPVFVSTDDLDAALAEAYADLSDATEWYEIWRPVRLCHTRPYYDVRTVFPDDEILTPTRAFNEQTNRWLVPDTPVGLDRGYRRWEQVYGQPERMTVRGLFWFGYWPIVAAETGTVKQYATALPPALTDEESPGFPDVFHRGLVEHALADLLPQFGEVTKALEAWTAYEAYEQGLDAYVQGRGAVPQVQGFGDGSGYGAR